LKADVVLATLEPSSDKDWPAVFRAVHASYHFLPPKCVMLRTAPLPLDSISEYEQYVVEGLLRRIQIGPTKKLWLALKHIANRNISLNICLTCGGSAFIVY
jgi:hypothetical protein